MSAEPCADCSHDLAAHRGDGVCLHCGCETVLVQVPYITTTADRALHRTITVGEAIAYLHRVGLHDAAGRMSSDRQIVVLRSAISDESSQNAIGEG